MEEVNQNEGLSVLMTQGSPRDALTFNLSTTPHPPRLTIANILTGRASCVMTLLSFCSSHLPCTFVIQISGVSYKHLATS